MAVIREGFLDRIVNVGWVSSQIFFGFGALSAFWAGVEATLYLNGKLVAHNHGFGATNVIFDRSITEISRLYKIDGPVYSFHGVITGFYGGSDPFTGQYTFNFEFQRPPGTPLFQILEVDQPFASQTFERNYLLDIRDFAN